MKIRRKVSYGFKNENIWEKVRWISGLSIAERYKMAVDFGDFITLVRGKKIKHDRGSFKTIQILKQE